MDTMNRFATPTMYAAMRLEYGFALAGTSWLLATHLREVEWPIFVGLFAIIDLVGYIPGAVVYRMRHGEAPRLYYVLYNVMHSFITWAVVLTAWAVLQGPRWAFLAVPIHLLGDRAIFGNLPKSFAVSFEPKPHKAFLHFERQLATSIPAANASRQSDALAPRAVRMRESG